MKRRHFLNNISLGVPLAFNAIGKNWNLHNVITNLTNSDSERILVIIYLQGGNDGLNTVVPLDQYSNLKRARGNIMLPESFLLKLTDSIAVHPSLKKMKDLFENEQLSILQNVGYETPNRSHFRSEDIWKTGSSAHEVLTSGWIGRCFEKVYPKYPLGFSDGPSPLAINIGKMADMTCEGEVRNLGFTFEQVKRLKKLKLIYENDIFGESYYEENLKYIKDNVSLSNIQSEAIIKADKKGFNNDALYPKKNPLAKQLKTVAKLISGGLKTKVYSVSLSGFDTHGGQSADPLFPGMGGLHTKLLQRLSTAVYAFQSDLNQQNLDHKVLGMTYSEFGRQIQSNANLGTDHGEAAPVFLFGTPVKSGIIGNNPVIDKNVEKGAGVAMEFDFRSVYASILTDWMNVSKTAVIDTFKTDIQKINILDI